MTRRLLATSSAVATTMVAATPHAAAQTNGIAPSASNENLHVFIAPFVHFPIDWDALLSAIWAGLPAAVVAFAFARWITNRWDLAKKRNELDLELTREYYDAIGRFKALGRQAEILQRPPRDPAQLVRWHTSRERLGEQAIDLEGRIDAILAKVILEDSADRDLSLEDRRRRRHLAGLLRVSVRNLREGLREGAATAPSFNSPGFWLSNRIVSELGQILYGRALEARPGVSLSGRHPSDYLELINYRTADLHMAAAALAPKVRAFEQARARSRDDDRKANVARLLQPGQWDLVRLTGKNPRAPAVRVSASLAVELAQEEVSHAQAITAALDVFAGRNNTTPQLCTHGRVARQSPVDAGRAKARSGCRSAPLGPE